MLTASTPDFLAHLSGTSGTSRRAILLSVVPGADPPSEDHPALSTIALTPVIEVEQQPTLSSSTDGAARSLQGFEPGVQPQPEFFALPALLDSLPPSSSSSQSAIAASQPTQLPSGGRRSLLCSGCPMCYPWGTMVAYTDYNAGQYICVTTPYGFWFPGALQTNVQVLYMCPNGTTTPIKGSGDPACVPVSNLPAGTPTAYSRRLAEEEQEVPAAVIRAGSQADAQSRPQPNDTHT
jgi:hypothetical protein